MKVYSLPDVTLATGAAQAVSATSQPCKWYQINGVTVGTTGRCGDANVGAARGAPIKSDGGQFAPPVAELENPYDLKDVYIIGTAADVYSVIYGV